MKEVGKKSAVSFYFEHGVFLKEKDRKEMNIPIGEAVKASSVKEDVYCYEICRDFAEINPEMEAKKILALFEDLIDIHFTFIIRHGLMKPKSQIKKLVDPLAELYPELTVKQNSPFAHFS